VFYGLTARPLRHRDDWGRAAREAGYSSYPVRYVKQRGQLQATLAVCDTAVARQLLARHENGAIDKGASDTLKWKG